MGAVGGLGDVLLEKADEDANITIESPKMKMAVARINGGNGGYSANYSGHG